MTEPRDWAAANEILTRNGKPVPTRKITNNTHLQRRPDNAIAVRFHDTDVLTWHDHAGGPSITLDSGGWLTMSTAERIGRYLPRDLRLTSALSRWTVTMINNVRTGCWPFHDGLILVQRYSGPYLAWHAINALTNDEVTAQDRHNKRVNDLIKRYIKTVLEDDDLDYVPGYAATDLHLGCALCLRTSVGKLVGDAFEDKQHLIDHLIELRVPYTVWLVACDQNGGQQRIHHLDLAKRDLAKYLRNTLYVGAVATKGGKRPAHSEPWRMTA